MIKSQRGMGTIMLLIILALAGALAYYAYKNVSGSGEAESCAGGFSYCMKVCRGTTTEAATEQACQQACERDKTACERRQK